MKQNIVYCLLTFLVSSCSSPTTEKHVPFSDSSKNKIAHKTCKFDTLKNYIGVDENDSSSFTNAELNKILKSNPELNAVDVLPPDILYNTKRNNSSNKDEEIRNRFESEAGKDEYFILYAYFLQKKNGLEKHQNQRKRLIKICRIINQIFANLTHGGTFFGHQHLRILGYVEYEIFSQIGYEEYLYKKYDYTRQKDIYISLLKQIIKDELSSDVIILEKKDKIQSEIALNKSVNQLNKLINNYSDLKYVQKFHYLNY
jgi:hypothetical protein